ncbi:hypothetical protein D3C73_873850 [compost metagenome]
MLTFEQKLSIFDSFPQLERRDVSLGRINYHYEQSAYDKKTVVYRLHPNGNGYVYAGLLEGYEVDPKGFVNIRDYDERQLRDLVEKSISSLSVNQNTKRNSEPTSSEWSQPRLNIQTHGGVWVNASGEQLTLKYEDDLWYIYSGISIEMVFESREEAGEYLNEEGFQPQK